MQPSKCLLPFLALLLVVNVGFSYEGFAKPGCRDSCGNVKISYPFGIGHNCSFDPWFEIECRPHAKFNKPFLRKLGIEVLGPTTHQYYTNPYPYSYDYDYPYHYPYHYHPSSYRTYDPYPDSFSYRTYDPSYPYLTVRFPPHNSCTSDQQLSSINLTGTPYWFSLAANLFVMDGCPGSAALFNRSNSILGACDTICHTRRRRRKKNYSISGICFEANCCTVQPDFYDDHLEAYRVEFESPPSANSCLIATLVSSDYAEDYVGGLLNNSIPSSSVAPVQLSWKLGKDNYTIPNTQCDDYGSCECDSCYLGDAYVHGGCIAIQECDPQNVHKTYYLRLLSTYGFIVLRVYGTRFGIGLGGITIFFLYRYITKKLEVKRRSTFFEHNGGLLLKQQLPSGEGVVGRTKIFTIEELERATDHFNDDQILGKGGFGTVYKGTLIDGSVVAIKKSKQLDTSLIKQFINEVVILSQTNHRNVVKLLGCCLEAKVPLLIYEYVPNGTLSEKIHRPHEEEGSFMSWETRLKIAVDSASAVAYLHSLSSTPIYHRDIKSSNILLDERHRAKVADFGCSRNIEIDQTHLTTLVQGTWGYLDPEYYQTRRFTEKSDVYSFGVVLLELLTSKKAVYTDETGDAKSLALQFQNSESLDMLDQRLVEEASSTEQLRAVVELAKSCVRARSGRRPTMKVVAMKLDMVLKSPSLVSNSSEQDFPDEFEEDVMSQISEEGFLSIPLPFGDHECLPLHTTI